MNLIPVLFIVSRAPSLNCAPQHNPFLRTEEAAPQLVKAPSPSPRRKLELGQRPLKMQTAPHPRKEKFQTVIFRGNNLLLIVVRGSGVNSTSIKTSLILAF